ncbi:Flagellar biosynthetic protein fliR [Salmonella enterica subsp. enterica]|uniref:Flagellar biosynthetic protein fliR n=1 Tax=Salmonella enterica I TaxID=59201 RepID=A0A379WRF1_SALET|nr:Flagellar biosynthetic protein fliR [Salmonella enterica subsp. enterica]
MAGDATILIGIALGFTMQFAFAAVRTAGEFIGLQMGLSFATFVDPGSHLNMPVLARIYGYARHATVSHFNGHLWLISLLVDTFHTLPIGSNPVNSNCIYGARQGRRAHFLKRTDAGIAGPLPSCLRSTWRWGY